MKIYADKRMLAVGLVGGTLSRHNGNMRELNNQTAVYQELGINPRKILHFHQTHSDTIICVATEQDALQISARPLQDADAWVFDSFPAQWGAAIVTADCVPLFLWDDTGSCGALAHCGWRGVVQSLAGKTARGLLLNHPNLRLNAWLGPHIQACCFEVQSDVANQFPQSCIEHKNGKLFVNLNTEIKRQLVQAGLKEEDIKTPYYCTCGDRENFFSWRRDHQKNLLLSFIYKP
ncbi:MAG: polyphenol oxidase family protein [Elusimicrobiaceae bacterium]|nr:polyphenol oxidase family protein [Elusimicrobiaceae bacterium]